MSANIVGNTLLNLSKFGTDPRNIVMTKSLSSLATKGPLTLLDNKTDKETKINSAIWQTADNSISLIGQFAVFPALPAVGNFIAKDMFKYTNEQAIKGVVNSTNFIGAAVLFSGLLVPFFDSKYLVKVINYSSEKLKGKKLMPNKEQEQELKRKQYSNYLQQIAKKQHTNLKCLINNCFDQAFLCKTSQIKDTILINTSKPFKIMANKLNQCNENLSRNIEKTLPNKNFPNKQKNNANIENKTDNLKKILENTEKTLLLGGASFLLMKLTGPTIGKKLEKFFISQSKEVSAQKQLVNTTLIEATTKPLVALACGEPYMAFRKFTDKMLSAVAIKSTEPIVNNIAKSASNHLTSEQIKGLKTFISLGIQNTIISNILVTLAVNKICNAVFKPKKTDIKENELKINANIETNNPEIFTKTIRYQSLSDKVQFMNHHSNYFDLFESNLKHKTC